MEASQEIEKDLAVQTHIPMALLFDAMAPLRFLVVEDDQSQWPLWESILKTTYPRAEIEWEIDEGRAERLLRHAYQTNQPYSMVISDVFLEGSGTGIDLWKRYGDAAAHFVFVSSFSMAKFDALIASLANTQGGLPLYLQKPLSAKTCKKALQSVL